MVNLMHDPVLVRVKYVEVACPCCDIGKVEVRMATYHRDDPLVCEDMPDGTCLCSAPDNKYIKRGAYREEVYRRAMEATDE